MPSKKINNTYIFQKKEDLEIEVGDIKQSDFKPRMKIMRWDNEVNFSVGVISNHKGINKQISDKIEWDDSHGMKARFYEKDADEFEFEIVLSEKPTSNVITLSIETKGFDFFYQPELTQEEIDGGCVRPENVVGSYAVYHKTMKGNYLGGNNYRAGKAFHIYRPFVTDAKGMKVWCDMHIEDDMQITIPQVFLDNAKYPVTIDPTFGCNPAVPGSSLRAYAKDIMIGSLFTSPTDVDTAQSISVYTKDTAFGPAFLKGCIVLHSTLNIISNGVADAAEITSTSGAWMTSTFGTDPTLTPSTEYLLMHINNPPTGYNIYPYYDTGDANQGHVDSSNSYTTPQNLGTATHSTDKYSIYCTYTAAAAAGARPSRVFGGPFVGPLGGPIQ